jgi:hypothetical protein
MTTSPVDTITLPTLPASGLNTPQVNFQISAELMKNSRKSSPIEPTANVLVVQDSDGSPMIFSIGTDHVFHLIKHESGTTDGWTVINLSTQFPDYAIARTFDVSQDLNGNISITLALSKQDQSTTDIFVASMLSYNYAQTDWSQFSASCHEVSGFDEHFAAEKILMGTSDDDKVPLTVIAGNIQGSKYYYQILDGKTSQTLEFPENVSKNPNSLMAIEIGHALGQRGITFLYKIGETQTLETTTLPDESSGSITSDFSPGNDGIPEPFRHLTYTCMTTVIGTQTSPLNLSSDIYVGTETGVYLFPNSRLGNMQKVTDKIKDVHEIVVRTDGDNLSIWVMASPSNLYYIYGKRDNTYTFNEPIRFSDDTIHLAPIRSLKRKANELFLINQDQVLTHYWQDPNSTLWHHRPLNIKNEGSLINFDSYTTHINLKDANDESLINKSIKVTCSEWLYATINGKTYSLDKDAPAEVPTDALGNVTIITAANDISSPIFHVEADFIDKTLNIYPNGRIKKAIRAIQSGTDLRTAQTQDGEALIPPGFSEEKLSGVAQNICLLNQAASQLKEDLKDNTYVAVTDKGIKHDGGLDLSSLPSDFFLAADNEESSASPSSNENSIASTIASTTKHILGDVLHELGRFFVKEIELIRDGVTYLAKGVSFFLKPYEQALHFMFTIAGKTWNVIINSIPGLSKVMGWLFKLLKAGLEKLMGWAGHIFGWDDIWRTHKLLATFLTNSLNYGAAELKKNAEQWKDDVAQVLDGVEQRLKEAVIPDAIRAVKPRQQARSNAKNSHLTNTLQAPGGNWSFYQIQHGGMLTGDDQHSHGDVLSQFYKDVVVPTKDAIWDNLKHDVADIEKLLSDSTTIADVYQLVSDLIETMIEPVKALIVGLIDFFEDLIEDIQHVLTNDSKIPVISDLYEWLTGVMGEQETFSAIKGMSLLLAVPVSYLCKAIKAATGKDPFARADVVLNDPEFFSKAMSGALTSSTVALQSEIVSIAEPTRLGRVSQAISSRINGVTTSLTNFLNPTSIVKLEVLAMSGEATSSFDLVYAEVGAIIAPIAEIFIVCIDGISMAEPPNKKDPPLFTFARSWEESIAFRIGFVAALFKGASTFPIREQGDNIHGRNLDISEWVFSLLNTAQGAIFRQQVSGIFAAGLNLVILAMAIPANLLNREDNLTWTVGMLSGMGGIAMGIGVYELPHVLLAGYVVAVCVCCAAVAYPIRLFLSEKPQISRLINLGGK